MDHRAHGRSPEFVRAVFTMNNANKRSLAADLRRPDDRALFVELIKIRCLGWNLKPGSLARLGFPTRTQEDQPPTCLFRHLRLRRGFDLPWRPAFDTVIQAICGLMDLTRAEGVPTKIGISIADTLGGTTACSASWQCLSSATARHRRHRSRDAGCRHMGNQNARMTGNRHPHTTLACKDSCIAASHNR